MQSGRSPFLAPSTPDGDHARAQSGPAQARTLRHAQLPVHLAAADVAPTLTLSWRRRRDAWPGCAAKPIPVPLPAKYQGIVLARGPQAFNPHHLFATALSSHESDHLVVRSASTVPCLCSAPRLPAGAHTPNAPCEVGLHRTPQVEAGLKSNHCPVTGHGGRSAGACDGRRCQLLPTLTRGCATTCTPAQGWHGPRS